MVICASLGLYDCMKKDRLPEVWSGLEHDTYAVCSQPYTSVGRSDTSWSLEWSRPSVTGAASIYWSAGDKRLNNVHPVLDGVRWVSSSISEQLLRVDIIVDCRCYSLLSLKPSKQLGPQTLHMMRSALDGNPLVGLYTCVWAHHWHTLCSPTIFLFLMTSNTTKASEESITDFGMVLNKSPY